MAITCLCGEGGFGRNPKVQYLTVLFVICPECKCSKYLYDINGLGKLFDERNQTKLTEDLLA
jgi:hypothetical protein